MAFLGNDIPKLGFGLMRLPRTGGDPEAPIDVDQVCEMVDLFMASGFCYFDTAYGYAGSEEAIRKALVERYPRDSFVLATKLPAWRASTREDSERMLETSLERTGAGYFDFYLLHNVGGRRAEFFDRYNTWDFAMRKRDEGVLRHVGFSFHDHAAFLEKILDEHPEMEFVQLQINYADWEDPVVESRRCYEVCRKRNVPVIVMEPLRGGALCRLPKNVAKILQEASPEQTQASWGLRFAAGLPGIITVLSGMSDIDQLRSNVETMSDVRPLDDSELHAISMAQAALDEIPRIPCTDCRYCIEGCPQGIPISDIFDAMNKYLVYDSLGNARFSYSFATRDGVVATDCVECGACEQACPQEIHIIEELKKCAEVLER